MLILLRDHRNLRLRLQGTAFQYRLHFGIYRCQKETTATAENIYTVSKEDCSSMA